MKRRITWLVQTTPSWDRSSPTFQLLTHACLELGIKLLPMDIEAGKPVIFPVLEGPVVIHGRKTLIEAARKDPVCNQGIFGNESDFRASCYQSHWGKRFLNATGETCTILEAAEYNRNARLFIRPDDDNKLFTGKIFNPGEFQAFINQQEGRFDSLMAGFVFVASPLEIDAEARLFLLQCKVISGSYYRMNHGNRISEELRMFAEESAQHWQPHPVFVLDVARVNGQYKIVEANGFNGSRFYHSNVTSIVDQVSLYQEKLFFSR